MNKNGSVVPLYRIGMDDGPQDHQTVVFRDGEEQWTAAIAGSLDATSNIAMNSDVSLQEFMRRPVKIRSFTWDPTSVTRYYQSFNPWELFFGNKRVINRINNYNNMQANLKVKIMVNGNPFYYGRLMAEYFVRPSFDQVTPRGADEPNLVLASQRLKVFIDPTTSQGGELHLPMILQNNAFNIPLADWDLQGTIYLREVANLKHANGGTEPLTITVYAWAENVKLSIPTIANSTDLVFQGDEYGSTPVSRIASNVSKVAGALKNIPWISPYAKATEMISNGIGRVAYAMGFSRPALIENPTIVKRTYMGNLCNTDRADLCTRLTLDSKQELTIDPLTVGVSVEDEMNISHIVQKECYLTQFTWSTTDIVDKKLYNLRVCPQLARQIGGVAMFNTPLATVANLFEWWRGSIDFRFQIIASQYHKGRLLFVYDPTEGGVLAPEQNVQYSRIVDLSDERDFNMRVCWGQPSSYLPLISTTNYVNQHTVAVPGLTKTATHNGFLTVYVLNELTTPNSAINNDIKIAIYVSGGDDIEFNVLSEKIRTSSYLPLDPIDEGTMQFQGAAVEDIDKLVFQATSLAPVEKAVETMDALGDNAPQNEIVKECVGEEIPTDHTNDVFFGETIASIRQLMKRYVFFTAENIATTVTTDPNNTVITDYDFPRYRGFIPTGATAVIGGAANVVNTNVITYMSPCYMGYRGSQRSKYNVEAQITSASAYKARIIRKADTAAGYSNVTTTLGSAATAGAFTVGRSNLPSGLTGTEVVGLDIHPVLEVEFPHYSALRFHHTKQMISPQTGDYNLLRHRFDVTSYTTTARAGVMRYVSTGEDFQLFLYQGQPPLYDIPLFSQ